MASGQKSRSINKYSRENPVSCYTRNSNHIQELYIYWTPLASVKSPLNCRWQVIANSFQFSRQFYCPFGDLKQVSWSSKNHSFKLLTDLTNNEIESLIASGKLGHISTISSMLRWQSMSFGDMVGQEFLQPWLQPRFSDFCKSLSDKLLTILGKRSTEPKGTPAICHRK